MLEFSAFSVPCLQVGNESIYFLNHRNRTRIAISSSFLHLHIKFQRIIFTSKCKLYDIHVFKWECLGSSLLPPHDLHPTYRAHTKNTCTIQVSSLKSTFHSQVNAPHNLLLLLLLFSFLLLWVKRHSRLVLYTLRQQSVVPTTLRTKQMSAVGIT